MIRTAMVTANMSGVTLFVTPLNQKGELEDVDIDNQVSGTPVTVKLVDEFSTSVGVVNQTSSAVTKTLLNALIAHGATTSIDRNSLLGSQTLGTVKAIGSVTDSGCVIIVRYNLH